MAGFDPFEPGFVESPYEQYARLRAEDPVHWSGLLGGWVLTRYADVAAVLRDPTVSVEIDNAAPTPLVEAERRREAERLGPGGEPRARSVVLLDDPDHGRLRRMLQRPFGSRPVARLRTIVDERVEAALGALRPRGEMDVVADFAYPLPVGVFCEILGLPDEDADQVRVWIQAVARSLDPVIDEAERTRCLDLLAEMEAYLEVQIEAKRADPGEDVLTALVKAEDDGEPMGGDELVAQIVTLYVAGHEPTTAVIAGGLLALLRQPDQLATLRAQPELLPNAVNELLRYDGPNQFVRRVALEPLTLGGRTIAPGDVVYASPAAANRDPARWDDPDAVRVDRADAGSHLQLGAGIHTCIGSHLARLQAEVALGGLVAGLDGVRVAGEPRWSDRMVLRSLRSLPVAFTPA